MFRYQETGRTGQRERDTGVYEDCYITYAFKDASDRVVYVGRASGQGNPIEVLNGRIAKGHEHFNPNLKAEVVAIQSSKSVSQGAEEFFIQGFREEGAKLTNIAEALDITKPDRRNLEKLSKS